MEKPSIRKGVDHATCNRYGELFCLSGENHFEKVSHLSHYRLKSIDWNTGVIYKSILSNYGCVGGRTDDDESRMQLRYYKAWDLKKASNPLAG